MDSLEHLITRSIKTYYKNKLYAPIIFLVILVVLAIVFPVGHLLVPQLYEEDQISLSEMYNSNKNYARFDLKNLYFTGYTSKWLDRTRGYSFILHGMLQRRKNRRQIYEPVQNRPDSKLLPPKCTADTERISLWLRIRWNQGVRWNPDFFRIE